ncbi:fumarylacetoacetate hydrolase family protein [Paenibacillus piri]|uniref:FAA hydrolase family protein n=1 Tax=Paenibacillus piri TaxID=2547395 RepID=A0A4R5KK63_9BACL|nr:fumarylacetoacetate hydrolase family protein [Paenibacillus piri]TDF95931.1 FAA hydrolase family protein [Paenibacillus piri]
MRLASVKLDGTEQAAIAADDGLVLIDTVNNRSGRSWNRDLFTLIDKGELAEVKEWHDQGGRELLAGFDMIPFHKADYAPLFRRPRKIWGIGANYMEKAAAMSVTPPNQEPLCFMKPDTSLIGPHDAILLPSELHDITAEAEIGIVIGKVCKYVREEDAMSVIAGFVPTLDMTAQDIHAKNPRFLGRSKCFDTFFSMGPHLVTPDECPEGERWTLETVLNGRSMFKSDAAHMIYSIPFIVSYFSGMMTLLPGDIIMTGTPGSVPLQAGDTVECRIGSFEPLVNKVAREITAYP